MIAIKDENHEPLMHPKIKGMGVFNEEEAESVLRNVADSVVYCLAESTGKFVRCTNMEEVKAFYGAENA